jgi:hypothetical protein
MTAALLAIAVRANAENGHDSVNAIDESDEKLSENTGGKSALAKRPGETL